MWKSITDTFFSIVAPPRTPRVCLGTPAPRTDEIVVQIPLGDHERAYTCAQARLTEVACLETVRRVACFASRRGLPVRGWLVTGLWQIPARDDRLARWALALAEDAGDATVWIATEDMPARFRRRLEGHLRRLGR